MLPDRGSQYVVTVMVVEAVYIVLFEAVESSFTKWLILDDDFIFCNSIPLRKLRTLSRSMRHSSQH